MFGRIEEIIINVTGYEAILLIDYEQLGEIYCSVMLDHEYDPTKKYDAVEVYHEDNHAMQLKVGDMLNSTLKVIYANKFKIIESNPKGYVQNIEKSPHAIFVGTVLEVTEGDILKCDLGSLLNKIDVEFDKSIGEVEQGDMINFSGEFTLVLDWDCIDFVMQLC